MVSILFFISSAKYSTLIEKNNIGVFQFLYFFSSFWGQFGPNRLVIHKIFHVGQFRVVHAR